MLNGKKILKQIESADRLTASLLALSETENICVLDSCGVNHLDSHFLIAGISPRETFAINNPNAAETLSFLDEKISDPHIFSIFSLSYEIGLKLENIEPYRKMFQDFTEPDVFLATFDCLIVHDYNTGENFLIGDRKRFAETEEKLYAAPFGKYSSVLPPEKCVSVKSNFSKTEYLQAIEQIKEFIRRGDTYQINLTQQITIDLAENSTPQRIFQFLRQNNPAPFAAFLQRSDSTIISSSPERFFKLECEKQLLENRDVVVNADFSRFDFTRISASPIKGTRPRGKTAAEDDRLRKELLASAKDRAENVMIVDLLRNDIGKICEFGSVCVEKLCDLETHPTLFHLVSTVSGKLRRQTNFSDVVRAVFPCGSITGAPKISTMRIIDRLETAARGLSMGAIGYSVPNSNFAPFGSMDLNVAIRTLTVRGKTAVFNVGGGIVIDSDAESEYAETLVKARALLAATGAKF